MKRKQEQPETPLFPEEEPALTPEARENQLISLSERLAEKQLREGTASSQVIVHYLKLGAMRERLEQEKLRNEIALLEAKKEALDSQKNAEEMLEKAISALRSYRGEDETDYQNL